VLTIIGCGNANRTDDGVGVFVAQALQKRLRAVPCEGVRVFDAGTAGMEVMFQARGSSQLVLIDASSSQSEPGAIFRVPGDQLDIDYEPVFSLHDFRWDHALAAGRKIFRDQFPADVTVYLIEAASLDFGLELTAPVQVAAAKVLVMLNALIDEHVAAGAPA
jgi:hydrogenase maturation protease